jgi:hypothetical protein
MASTIQIQTISAVDDKCIAMSASQWGRAHGYGDSWNTLRVALNFNVEDTGSDLTGTVLRIGLCHGTTNMPGDAATDNSYGFKFNPGFTRYGGPPPGYYPAGDGLAFSRVGSSESTSSTNLGHTTQSWLMLTGTTRTCFFLDIIKGASYTFNAFSANTNGSQVDVTPSDFLTLANNVTPSRSLYTYASPTGTGLAIDTGANGILDTVYVGWNLLTPRLFIGNLAVVKLA